MLNQSLPSCFAAVGRRCTGHATHSGAKAVATRSLTTVSSFTTQTGGLGCERVVGLPSPAPLAAVRVIKLGEDALITLS
jgi:hypothetical protein